MTQIFLHSFKIPKLHAWKDDTIKNINYNPQQWPPLRNTKKHFNQQTQERQKIKQTQQPTKPTNQTNQLN